MPRCLTVVLLSALAGHAGAEEAAPEEVERPHAAYLELFGKGGLGGVGYDVLLRRKLGVGAVASFYVIDEQRILSFSPYLSTYVLGERRHRWFVHGGPQIMRVAIRSPVPEWPGTTSAGVGAEVSSGWEYRNGALVRIFAMLIYGRGGLEPWMGISVGWVR